MTATCQLCGTGAPDPICCPSCQAMFYCSEKHRKLHWRVSHHEECARMALHMLRRQELEQHSVGPPAGTSICQHLNTLGCHLQGPWAAECPCSGSESSPTLPGGLAALVPGAAGIWAAAKRPQAQATRQQLAPLLGRGFWQQPAEQVPCLLSQVPQQMALHSWDDYYALRGIPQASPVAILMDSVLTVYWALLKLRQLAVRLPHEGPVTVHYLGAQKEVAQWPLFLGLGSLLPSMDLHLHFIGPAVPSAADGLSLHVPSPAGSCCGEAGCSCVAQPGAQPATESSESSGQEQGVSGQHQGQQTRQAQQPGGRVCLAWHQGLYHEVAPKLVAAQGPPDLVVAPNAGLAAYPSWVETLQLLAGNMHSRASRGSSKLGIIAPKDMGNSSSDPCGSSACPSECQTANLPQPAVCLFTDYNEEAAHRARELCQAVLDGLLGVRTAEGSAGRQSPGQQPDTEAEYAGCLPSGCGDGRQQQQQGLASGCVVRDAPRGSGALRLSGVEVNPFRSCRMMHPSDNVLPTCSNGFAVWLTAEAGM